MHIFFPHFDLSKSSQRFHVCLGVDNARKQEDRGSVFWGDIMAVLLASGIDRLFTSVFICFRCEPTLFPSIFSELNCIDNDHVTFPLMIRVWSGLMAFKTLRIVRE